MTDSLQAPSLRWELFIRKRASATQGVPPGKESLSWVANTVTLFWGQRDAVLVDTFLSDAHSAELADWIETKGRTLRTIYLTHAHPDLFFGLTLLLKRFPEARAVAMPNVVEAMRVQSSDEVLEPNWKRRFPGQVPEQLTVAGSLEAGRFELEGHEFRVIDLGHTDTDDTTGPYVPSLDLVIAGDAVYNGTHPFLVETDRTGRRALLAALDRIQALEPDSVIVGSEIMAMVRKGQVAAIPANDMTVQATFNAKLFGMAAYATIKGFVVKWTLRKCQASSFNITRDIRGEAHLVERAFNVGLGVLAEVVQVITQQLELQATWHRQ